jgi:DNA-binding Xre family transcriptional regulator
MLAMPSSCSARAVAKLASGRLDVRLSTIVAVARALDVTPGALLDTVADAESGRTVRFAGPLQGLGAAGWRKVASGTPASVAVPDLTPRAGPPEAHLAPHVIAWAMAPEGRHSHEEGQFLARIRGNSMEPVLLDGDWCLFSSRFLESECFDRMGLVREADASGLTSWIVKRIVGVRRLDEERTVLHIASLNPAFSGRELTIDGSGDVELCALVKQVLTRRLRRRR